MITAVGLTIAAIMLIAALLFAFAVCASSRRPVLNSLAIAGAFLAGVMVISVAASHRMPSMVVMMDIVRQCERVAMRTCTVVWYVRPLTTDQPTIIMPDQLDTVPQHEPQSNDYRILIQPSSPYNNDEQAR